MSCSINAGFGDLEFTFCLSLGNFVYVLVFGGAGSLLLQGPFSPGVMLGRLTAVLSLVEHRLSGKQGSGVVAPGLQSTGSVAVVPGKWDLPRSVMEPVSPAAAGRFFTPEPPEKL